MLSRLFIAALWSPAGKGLASLLSFVMFNVLLSLIHVVSRARLWNMIVSIPDLCRLPYFYSLRIIFSYLPLSNPCCVTTPILEINLTNPEIFGRSFVCITAMSYKNEFWKDKKDKIHF